MSTFKQIHKIVCSKQMGFPGSASVKTPPSNAGDVRDTGSSPGPGRSPGGEPGNPLPIHAWRIPWIEESGGVQSIGSQRVGHDGSD